MLHRKAFALLSMLAGVGLGEVSAQTAAPLGPLPFITPVSEYTSTYVINGAQNITGTARTIEIIYSNALQQGTLIVGDYNVNITCVPP
jgi:hypothetical protein